MLLLSFFDFVVFIAFDFWSKLFRDRKSVNFVTPGGIWYM